MRRIVMFNRVSADGWFADADGGLGWVVPEPALDQKAASNLGSAGTILFGRRTYEMFESFWPHAVDEDPHAPGRHSPEMLAMGRWINEAEKIVFSRTRREVAWRNSRLLPAFDPAEVQTLKNGPGKDIMIFGSGSIVTLLTEHRLIDEYRIVVGPVLLGNGQSMLRGMPSGVRLELRDVQPHPCGNVTLTYAPAG